MLDDKTWNIFKIHEVDKEEFLKIVNGNNKPKVGNLILKRKTCYTIDQLIEKAGLIKDEIEII